MLSFISGFCSIINLLIIRLFSNEKSKFVKNICVDQILFICRQLLLLEYFLASQLIHPVKWLLNFWTLITNLIFLASSLLLFLQHMMLLFLILLFVCNELQKFITHWFIEIEHLMIWLVYVEKTLMDSELECCSLLAKRYNDLCTYSIPTWDSTRRDEAPQLETH